MLVGPQEYHDGYDEHTGDVQLAPGNTTCVVVRPRGTAWHTRPSDRDPEAATWYQKQMDAANGKSGIAEQVHRRWKKYREVAEEELEDYVRLQRADGILDSVSKSLLPPKAEGSQAQSTTVDVKTEDRDSFWDTNTMTAAAAVAEYDEKVGIMGADYGS